ncbi:MAG: hypothetical protein A3A02_01685 [Candidatus Buchananbacteria bacterium RIFCSPLOWO2_01_FULL_39_33]|uniref:TRASH domain-containing protein n=1 Tax=Candidatus Buchananbacteria bacterium RIFCSPLOWO2_01_FULL_39_33 TaxID=1797543 RepID=A0A1G1YIU6_9BACT|nr:MAG: hypothetical protein A3A02_01685 [Candidatus Buchananbacteria bacterium RIFCSPLOWO2_01_FULL_39_33]
MFKLFGQKKCLICGMIANSNFISRYGEKFCSTGCLAQYEKQNKVADHQHSGDKNGGCCH